MPDLIPVDHDPFASAGSPTLAPVDHDPFAQTSTAGDVAKSFGSGLVKGVVGLPGIPGDMAGLINQAGTPLVQAAMNRWASPEAAERFRQIHAARPNPLPTSEDIVHRAEEASGIHLHQPQTTAGHYAQTIGEFAPNVVGGPEGLLARSATRVVAPAVVSEAAGQATQGTALEPYARVAGAVAGHAGATGLRPAPEINAPSLEELHDAASQGYRNARGYGVEIRPQPVSRLADDILSDLGNDGFRERNVPKTWDAVNELKNPAGRNVTVDDLESVRKVLNRAGANPLEGAEREASRRAISAVDNYLENLDPAHVAINPQFAGHVADEIGEARSNWAAMKRGEAVENKLESALDQTGATGSGSNINNVTRQKIKQILASPKQLRGFSPAETAQMRTVVRGTPVGNVTRKIGKLAPEGIVSGALGVDLGLAMAGSSPMALGVPLLGKIAKTIADRSTERQARRLSQMVRARSPAGRALPQPVPPAPLSVSGLVRSGTFGGLAGSEQGGGFAGGRAEGGQTDDESLSPEDSALASSMTHWPEGPNPKRASGGRIIGAKTQGEVGLSENATGVAFRCGTCTYIKRGVCQNPNPELTGRKVKPHWCCNLYDHPGMKVIEPGAIERAAGGRAIGGDVNVDSGFYSSQPRPSIPAVSGAMPPLPQPQVPADTAWWSGPQLGASIPSPIFQPMVPANASPQPLGTAGNVSTTSPMVPAPSPSIAASVPAVTQSAPAMAGQVLGAQSQPAAQQSTLGAPTKAVAGMLGGLRHGGRVSRVA